MTQQQLDRANEIKHELDLIGRVLQLVPSSDSYGCKWEIYTGDKEALSILVLRHKRDFMDMLLRDKQQFEKELEEL